MYILEDSISGETFQNFLTPFLMLCNIEFYPESSSFICNLFLTKVNHCFFLIVKLFFK